MKKRVGVLGGAERVEIRERRKGRGLVERGGKLLKQRVLRQSLHFGVVDRFRRQNVRGVGIERVGGREGSRRAVGVCGGVVFGRRRLRRVVRGESEFAGRVEFKVDFLFFGGGRRFLRGDFSQRDGGEGRFERVERR